MKSALTCGVVALAFLAGTLAVDGWRRRGTTRISLDRVVTSVAAGMALLAPAFVLLAELRLFVPAAIGGIGWLGLSIWMLARRRTRWSCRVRAPDAIIALAAVGYLFVAVNGRDEPWGAGRDQQVYAEFAILLADAGRTTMQVRPQDDADAELLRAIGTDREVNRYLGVTRTARGGAVEEASYLPLGWPAWLAFAYAAGGYPALHAANALIFALGAMLLYPVLRRSTGRALATAAVVALFALPSSVWVAGVSLSEPLAMVIWLATMALFALRGRRALRWAPLIVFAAATVRIDALMLVPALIAAAFASAALDRSKPDERETRRFAVTMVLSLIAALVWHASLHASYLRDNIDQVVPIVVATLLTACLTVGSAAWYRLAQRALAARFVACVLASIVIALGIYCLLIRPGLSPFAIIHNGSGLDGTRDYREDSLRNLAVYVGWPLLLLALGGAALAMTCFARPAALLAERVVLTTGLAYCALYLWAPLVSPDHPWAIRRFIPVVIPMTVALAALALRRIARQRTGSRVVAAGVLMVGAACGAAAASGTPMLTLRENRGAAALLAAIDATMPDALVVTDLPAGNMGIVLSIARGRRIVVADFQRTNDRAAIAHWFETKAREGKPAWLLDSQAVLPTGAQTTVVGQWQFDRLALIRTTQPPARVVKGETVKTVLSRVDGLDADVAFKGFGGRPAWGIPDAGFFPSDATPFGTLRMTDGTASLEVPSDLLRDAALLEFEWFSWAPRGEMRETTVRIGGILAWEGELTPGVSKTVVPLPDPLPRGTVRVEIVSAAFDPRALDPADYRDRVGIGVLAIRAMRQPDALVRLPQRAPAPGTK